jgi:Holliday junction resolvase RusA-like endonuclease
LIRSTEDALTQAGIWADDARVVEYERAVKVFPREDPEALDAPGAIIEIRRRAE